MKRDDNGENTENLGSRSVRARDISGQVFTGDIEGGVRIDASRNKRIRISKLSLDEKYLTKMPSEYAESLRKFSESVNKGIQVENVEDSDSISQLQENTNEVAKELADIKQGEVVKYTKKSGIRAKLAKVAESLVRMSPKIAPISN